MTKKPGKHSCTSAGAAVQTVGHVRPNKPALKWCDFSFASHSALAKLAIL